MYTYTYVNTCRHIYIYAHTHILIYIYTCICGYMPKVFTIGPIWATWSAGICPAGRGLPPRAGSNRGTLADCHVSHGYYRGYYRVVVKKVSLNHHNLTRTYSNNEVSGLWYMT